MDSEALKNLGPPVKGIAREMEESLTPVHEGGWAGSTAQGRAASVGLLKVGSRAASGWGQ